MSPVASLVGTCDAGKIIEETPRNRNLADGVLGRSRAEVVEGRRKEGGGRRQGREVLKKALERTKRSAEMVGYISIFSLPLIALHTSPLKTPFHRYFNWASIGHLRLAAGVGRQSLLEIVQNAVMVRAPG